MILFVGSRRRIAETAGNSKTSAPIPTVIVSDIRSAQEMPATTQRDAQNKGRFTQEFLSDYGSFPDFRSMPGSSYAP